MSYVKGNLCLQALEAVAEEVQIRQEGISFLVCIDPPRVAREWAISINNRGKLLLILEVFGVLSLLGQHWVT